MMNRKKLILPLLAFSLVIPGCSNKQTQEPKQDNTQESTSNETKKENGNINDFINDNKDYLIKFLEKYKKNVYDDDKNDKKVFKYKDTDFSNASVNDIDKALPFFFDSLEEGDDNTLSKSDQKQAISDMDEMLKKYRANYTDMPEYMRDMEDDIKDD